MASARQQAEAMEDFASNNPEKDSISRGNIEVKVKRGKTPPTSARRQSHEPFSARKHDRLSPRPGKQSTSVSARKKSPIRCFDQNAQKNGYGQLLQNLGGLGIAPARSHQASGGVLPGNINSESKAIKTPRNGFTEGCAFIAKSFDMSGMNGNYSETGDTFSGCPIFSNGKFKLYQTNLNGQSSASKADRWVLQELGKGSNRILGYASAVNLDRSSLEHFTWWLLVDGAWQPCNGRFQRKRRPVAPLHSSARSQTPDGSSRMNKAYERYIIEGFTVYVESSVQSDQRSNVIAQLRGDLCEVVRIVPVARIEILRSCAIWASATATVQTEEAHGMCFVAKAKSIEISNIAKYLEWHTVQPSMLLYELAFFLHNHLRSMEEKENGRSLGGVIAPIEDGSGRVRVSGFSLLCTRGINGIYTPTGETSGGKPMYINGDDRDSYRLYFTRPNLPGQRCISGTDSWQLEHSSREQVVAFACCSQLFQAQWKSVPGSYTHQTICFTLDDVLRKGLYSRDAEQQQLMYKKPVKYFANATISFFSSSRFHNVKYPFLHGELRGFDPSGYGMCEAIWDVRGDSVQSRVEFSPKWLANLSGRLPFTICRTHFNEADTDKDGVLTHQEFLQLSRSLSPTGTRADEDTLRFADANSSGAVDWWGCLAWFTAQQEWLTCEDPRCEGCVACAGKQAETTSPNVSSLQETEMTSPKVSPLQSPLVLRSGLLRDCKLDSHGRGSLRRGVPVWESEPESEKLDSHDSGGSQYGYPFQAVPRPVKKLPPLPMTPTAQKTRPNYQAIRMLKSSVLPEHLE